MRETSPSTRFRRDFKREAKGRHGCTLAADVAIIAEMLARDETLPAKLCDHALSGHWIGYRDCHVKPDLILIYRYPDDQTLQLIRLGSHSELAL